MNALAGPFLAGAALLGLAGAGKLRRPVATANALRAAGLPGTPRLVRIGAAAELAVAIGAIVFGNWAFCGLVAASYVGFAAFVLAAMRQQVPLSSCGCFGRADTPPSVVHVVLNVAFAGVAGVMALDPMGGIGRVLESQPMLGIPFLALTATSVGLAYVAMTVLPATLALTTSGRR